MRYPDYKVSRYDTFYELMLNSCREYSDYILFETPKKKTTYHEFNEYVSAAETMISETKGKYILIDIRDTELFAVALFAVVISGNIACIHNPHLDHMEKPYQDIPIFRRLRDRDIRACISRTKGQECSKTHRRLGGFVDSRSLAVVLCSSGTSEVPKGICLSQKNLCSCAEAGIKKFYYPAGCKYLSVLPMWHAFGIVADLLGAVYTGGTLCIPDSVLQSFSSLKLFRPDTIHMPPAAADKLGTMLMKSRDPDGFTGGRLTKILCAGAPLSVRTIHMLRRFHIRAYAAYGLTECSPCVSINRDFDYKDGSCGLILDNNEVRTASDGEILVKGDGVMLGYLNHKDLTAKAIKNGWLYTGDIGFIDEDGFLFITGRKSNMAVFSDGTKYIPEAIEKELDQFEYIHESMVIQEGDCWKIYLCLEKKQQSENCENIKNEVSVYVRKRTMHHVSGIEVQYHPLPRNSNGKLLRRTAWGERK